MNFDVIIIGAGPGGIFAAYELMQKNPQPSAQGGKPKKTAEEIMQIVDPVERQRAIAENIELFD